MCWMCEMAASGRVAAGNVHTMAATPLGHSVPMTGDFHKDVLLQGSKWDHPNLTYSLWDNVFELYKDPAMQALGQLIGGWEAKAKAAFHTAIATYETFTNLTMTYVDSAGKPNLKTDIEAMPTGFLQQVTIGSVGLGVFPDKAFGDQWLQMMGLTRNEFPNVEGSIYFDNYHEVFKHCQLGGKGFWVMLHEIGHTLGLKHTHDDGGNGRPTLASLHLEPYDNTIYSMMSYKAPEGGTLDKGNIATPMVWDMLALQEIYGTNWAYHAGNDVYALADNGIITTIWDGGGHDMMDASGVNGAVTLDLRAGQYSHYGSTVGAVAYKVTIEDGMGGSNNDSIIGNEANNVVGGGGGSDTVHAGANDDTVYGGRGAGDANDGSDVLYGDKGSDAIYGNAGDDTIYGGTGMSDPIDGDDLIIGGLGNDVIYGNAGNDTIIGSAGNDTIHGGLGSNRFEFGDGNGVDRLLAFFGAGSVGGDVLAVQDHINGTSIHSAADVLAHASAQGNDLWIDFGSGNMLTIIDGVGITTGDIIIF